MSLFAFAFDFALLLLDLDLPDLADLLDFELFFELELFLLELELLDFDFELEEDRFVGAASAKGASAPRQIMAARGIANLIIFTTSKIRLSVASWLFNGTPPNLCGCRKSAYGDSRSIRQAPSPSRV